MFFAISAFRSWYRLLIRSWCQHATIVPPKIHQNCIKTGTWKASIFWSIVAWIVYRFSFDLEPKLEAILAPKTRPRRLQDASKTAPKTKCATFFAPAVIWVDFWSIFDWSLIDFRSIFDWFSNDFRSILNWYLIGSWTVFWSLVLSFSSSIFDWS